MGDALLSLDGTECRMRGNGWWGRIINKASSEGRRKIHWMENFEFFLRVAVGGVVEEVSFERRDSLQVGGNNKRSESNLNYSTWRWWRSGLKLPFFPVELRLKATTLMFAQWICIFKVHVEFRSHKFPFCVPVKMLSWREKSGRWKSGKSEARDNLICVELPWNKKKVCLGCEEGEKFCYDLSERIQKAK